MSRVRRDPRPLPPKPTRCLFCGAVEIKFSPLRAERFLAQAELNLWREAHLLVSEANR